MLDAIILIVFAAMPAIVLHEFAHGQVAAWFGDDTAKKCGRLTLNPLVHIDPLGTVIIPGVLFLLHFFGVFSSLVLFGWAKPVPVNFMNLRPVRLGLIATAGAGPLVNIILAWVLIRLYHLPFLHSFQYVLGWGILINLTLAVFNLIPIPPLDGSRIVSGFLPARIAILYNKFERFGMIIIIILVQLGALEFLYPLISQLAYLLGIQL